MSVSYFIERFYSEILMPFTLSTSPKGGIRIARSDKCDFTND